MFISSSDQAESSSAGGPRALDAPVFGAEGLVAALRAAGEPSRLRALALLAHGELAVGEIAQALGQSQPRVSRHLKLLTESGLAQRAPEGAWVFYRQAAEGTPERALAAALIEAVDPDDPVFAHDRQRLVGIRNARAEAAQAYFARNAADWDRLRALHLPEADIEAAMREAAGPGPFDLMIDAGVGSGRMMQVFADIAHRAEGFDVSRQMLALARSALAELPPGKAGLRLGDIYAPPFPAANADLVILHQVLHFLPDPGGAVAQAARLLKLGGRLLIADFAPHDLEFLRSEHAHRRLGFSDREIADWCAAAGIGPLRILTLGRKGGEGEELIVKIWAGDRAMERGRA